MFSELMLAATHITVIAKSNAISERRRGQFYRAHTDVQNETAKCANAVAGRVYVHVSVDWRGRFRLAGIGDGEQALGFPIE